MMMMMMMMIPNNLHVISVKHFHKKRLMTKSNDDNSFLLFLGDYFATPGACV